MPPWVQIFFPSGQFLNVCKGIDTYTILESNVTTFQDGQSSIFEMGAQGWAFLARGHCQGVAWWGSALNPYLLLLAQHGTHL